MPDCQVWGSVHMSVTVTGLSTAACSTTPALHARSFRSTHNAVTLFSGLLGIAHSKGSNLFLLHMTNMDERREKGQKK